jgi:hypothetical protein
LQLNGLTVALSRKTAGAAKVRLNVNRSQWALAPGGKRVAVITPVEAAEARKPDHTVVFLLNFFDYLRQRVPMEK